MTNSKMEDWKGYFIGALFFIASIIQSILYQNGFHESAKLSVQVRAGLIDVIYRKSLTVSPAAAASGAFGEIVNLLAVDLERMQMAIQFIWVIWFAPLNIIIATGLLYIQLGWVAFVGLGIVVCALLINGFAGAAMRALMVCLNSRGQHMKPWNFSYYLLDKHKT